MFNKLLDLLPPAIVRKIGNSSFANLARRQRIETWIVIEKPEELEDLQPDCYYYCGWQIKAVSSTDSWDWFVYGGCGIDLLETGSNPTEEGALAAAKNWIDGFFSDGA